MSFRPRKLHHRALSAGLGACLGLGVASLPTGGPAAAMNGDTFVGPTGNIVEMVDPGMSTYIPRVAKASDRDEAKARGILDGVRSFCQAHTIRGLKAHGWSFGPDAGPKPSHLWNPGKDTGGLHPANPKAALVYDGKLGGVMLSGVPLPYMGSIPRAHGHHMAMPVEMVHVYCTPGLRNAFTPSRRLGVLADVTALRWKIRSNLMDLTERQLRDVRSKVRGYVNARAATDRPDPVLKRIRIEIRESVQYLNERECRSVWRLVKVYQS